MSASSGMTGGQELAWIPTQGARTMLDEFASKSVLEEAGIRCPGRIAVASTSKILSSLASRPLAFPIAVKLLCEGLEHKSRIGGVALNVTSEGDAVAEGERILSTAGAIASARGLVVKGLLLEEMVVDARCELLLGVIEDSTFGMVLGFGMGGALTELYRDVAYARLPVTAEEARALIRRTQIGSQNVDTSFRMFRETDLIEIIVRLAGVAGLTHAHPEILEIELNPIIATDWGLVIADAVVSIQADGTPAKQPS